MDEYRDHVIYRFPKRRRIVVQPWMYAVAAALLCIVVGLLFAAAAKAQQQQADPLQSLSLDWQALATAQGHVATGIQELARAVQQAKAAEAYWKAWCGDSPGCAPQPAQAQK